MYNFLPCPSYFSSLFTAFSLLTAFSSTKGVWASAEWSVGRHRCKRKFRRQPAVFWCDGYWTGRCTCLLYAAMLLHTLIILFLLKQFFVGRVNQWAHQLHCGNTQTCFRPNLFFADILRFPYCSDHFYTWVRAVLSSDTLPWRCVQVRALLATGISNGAPKGQVYDKDLAPEHWLDWNHLLGCKQPFYVLEVICRATLFSRMLKIVCNWLHFFWATFKKRVGAFRWTNL